MKKTSVKTIGILTSGGDAPGLNAAIRGVCRSAMINYGMKIVGIRNGYRGLVNGDCFTVKSDDVYGILTRGGTILGTARVINLSKSQCLIVILVVFLMNRLRKIMKNGS